ncbi:hypothetical protein [Legionella gresilensis]|uniref:hypothetical protein n=1 Tax=Legionella gresilensis TaxID=91823 RepID=UPI0010413DCC|nr:hypothetical protein [Legionella gresilensis]
MLETKGNDKLTLFEAIRQANLCLVNYKALQTSRKTLNQTTSASLRTESRTAIQTMQIARQRAQTISGNSLNSSTNKEPTKTSGGIKKKTDRYTSLGKRLDQTKFEADKAKSTAIDAVKKYNHHKTPKARHEAFRLLKDAKIKKNFVYTLQTSVQNLETIRGKTTQLKICTS